MLRYRRKQYERFEAEQEPSGDWIVYQGSVFLGRFTDEQFNAQFELDTPSGSLNEVTLGSRFNSR